MLSSMMPRRSTFPERSHPGLRPLRLERGLSQDELGFRSGIPQARLSRAERGYLWLRDDERRRLADVLSVEPGALDVLSDVALAAG